MEAHPVERGSPHIEENVGGPCPKAKTVTASAARAKRCPPAGMGDPQNSRDQCPGMADPDEKDEIDQVECPRDGMSHACGSPTPNELPCKGEKGPGGNTCQRLPGYSRAFPGLGIEFPSVIRGNGFAIHHSIPLLLGSTTLGCVPSSSISLKARRLLESLYTLLLRII